jgi:tRNA-specific adenosine deaminase 1
MEATADEIAEVVLQKFHSLPSKCKPLVRGSGLREWVPLSGIVAEGLDFLPLLEKLLE